jgi:hypothetical protein
MEIAAVQREQAQIVKEEAKKVDPQSEEKREIKADSEEKELVARAERNKLEVGSEFSATA